MSAESHQRFSEAMKLLHQVAEEKKEEMQKVLGDKFGTIRDALQTVVTENQETIDHVKKMAEKTFEQGSEKIKDAATDLDKKMKENPWPYVAGIAFAALLLGHVLGSSKK